MDRKLLVLSILFMVAFIAFTSFVVFREPIGRLTRAANLNKVVSPQTSLIFAWPLTVAANGQEKTEVTVFVRDSEGRGIDEEPVQITTSVGTAASLSGLTDSDGKATFTITSDKPGLAQIEATANSVKLRRTVSVQFK